MRNDNAAITVAGMLSQRLSVHDYQDLVDQGWRRSGTFLYKPLQQDTCCSPYTIRLDVTQFRASKQQRRLQKKWENYGLKGQGPSRQGSNEAMATDNTCSSPRKDAESSSSKPAKQPSPAVGMVIDDDVLHAVTRQLEASVKVNVFTLIIWHHAHNRQQLNAIGSCIDAKATENLNTRYHDNDTPTQEHLSVILLLQIFVLMRVELCFCQS